MRKKQSMAINRLALFLLVFTIAIPLSFAYSLEYTTNKDTITMNYDGLNRLSSKTTSGQTFNYTYDTDYYGTLSSIESDDMETSLEYDDKLRVIKEIVEIDGITFEKEYLYNSQDEVISVSVNAEDIDFITNTLGKVQKIPGYIDNSSYNAFGSILTRDYNNGLTATFTYDSENNRLASISIPSVQSLSYTYDNVGNILSITDTISNRNHVLAYDNLDRLVNATIGNDVYTYSFSPIGNIMKIIKNNDSKKFVYQGAQAHAPSTVIEGGLGVDVYNPKEIGNSSKNRTFEFFLHNENDNPVSDVSLSVDFGDGNSFTNNSIEIDDSLWVFVENDYTYGGDYSLNITADYTTTGDSELFDTKFGARARRLDKIFSNVSDAVFEFEIYNDVGEQIDEVSWTCDSVSSLYNTNLSGFSSLFDYLAMNYSTPGNKELMCSVSSLDGSESISLDYGIRGVEVDEFDVLATDVSSRIVGYTVVNNFEPATTMIEMDGSSQNVDLASGEEVMVFTETNYSTDGTHNMDINVSAAGYSTSHVDTFTIEGVSIENYERQTTNYTNNVIMFDVRNNWHSGDVNWSIDDPAISDTANLNTNETLMVFVEDSAVGSGRTEVLAVASVHEDELKNAFEINPLDIESLLTLSEGITSTSEIIVENNLNTSQQFSLNFNTTVEAVDSSSITVTDRVFVFIESNFSDLGVYKTTAYINSSAYNDTQSGVVVVG